MTGAGVFYLCQWLAGPLTIGFGRFTEHIVYRGDFNGYVVMPLVAHLPQAFVAVVAAVMVVWLVESKRPMAWVSLPTAFYVFLGFYAHHWSRPPLPLDRLSETIGALFPALTCVCGGIAATHGLKRVKGDVR